MAALRSEHRTGKMARIRCASVAEREFGPVFQWITADASAENRSRTLPNRSRHKATSSRRGSDGLPVAVPHYLDRSMTEFLLKGFINPMKLLEWEDHFPPNRSKNPTTDRLLEFLCALGLSGDIAAFKGRYRKVSARDQRLFLFPEEPRLAENLFDPLRQAKTSYLIGNYVAVIGLCGMVAEKVAIFIGASRFRVETGGGRGEIRPAEVEVDRLAEPRPVGLGSGGLGRGERGSMLAG